MGTVERMLVKLPELQFTFPKSPNSLNSRIPPTNAGIVCTPAVHWNRYYLVKWGFLSSCLNYSLNIVTTDKGLCCCCDSESRSSCYCSQQSWEDLEGQEETGTKDGIMENRERGWSAKRVLAFSVKVDFSWKDTIELVMDCLPGLIKWFHFKII